MELERLPAKLSGGKNFSNPQAPQVIKEGKKKSSLGKTFLRVLIELDDSET